MFAAAPVPAQIFVKGNGLTEQAIVTFTIRSGTTPVAGQDVRVQIVNNIGDIEFNTKGNKQPVVLTSDSSGQIALKVFSGTVPTPVKIRAEWVGNSSVFTETQNLTIASGPPSQKRFSLSASKYSFDSGADGDTTRITVYAADRQGNPVPDGTVINFTSEGGQVQPSCTIATALSNNISSCSVTLVTQDPRPDDGRVSVLAYAEGTKEYIDLNGNNTFDPGTPDNPGDTLVNIGNAFRDDNENNVYDPGEFVISRGVSGGTCSSSGAPFPAVANTCSNELQTTVRRQINFFFAGPATQFNISSANTTGIDFALSTFGKPNIPMPAGTTITATARSGGACVVNDVSPSVVPNQGPGTDPMVNRSTSHFVSLTCTPQTGPTTETIRITATTPISNRSTSIDVTVNDPAAVAP
jgi:hypothetical protein